MNEKPESVRRRTNMKKLVSALAAVIVAVVLLADPNSCCPDCEGCGNNWRCTVAVLGAISACCGTGSGTAKCEDGAFCVTCDSGATCDCDYSR
jgi:hypothetical protein